MNNYKAIVMLIEYECILHTVYCITDNLDKLTNFSFCRSSIRQPKNAGHSCDRKSISLEARGSILSCSPVSLASSNRCSQKE